MAAAPAALGAEVAQAARMVEAPALDYPPVAQRNEIEGTVHVQLRVSASGQPEDLQIVRSSGHRDLDRAALSAARRSRFSPAKDATGTPIDSKVIVPYKFVLQD